MEDCNNKQAGCGSMPSAKRFLAMGKKFYSPDLAELHNLYYADFVENAARGAIAELRKAGIQSGVVLDLGCGGGQLSLRLLRKG